MEEERRREKSQISSQLRTDQEERERMCICFENRCAISLLFSESQMGFFKRVRPPQEEQEREQLQPHENGEGTSEA